jgi:hypothetical protein
VLGPAAVQLKKFAKTLYAACSGGIVQPESPGKQPSSWVLTPVDTAKSN